MPGWHLYRKNTKVEDIERLRGQTLYVQIYIQFIQGMDRDWALYFDDFRAVPLREATISAPLPSDLIGDGQRPILLTGPGSASDKTGIFRVDSDEGNRVRIADLPFNPFAPTWSPDGKQIAFKTDWLSPDTPLDPNGDAFVALASQVHVMNADGSGDRVVLTMPGQPGRKDTPRGCLRFNTCTDKGSTALDAKVTHLTWTPDGKDIVTTICRITRWYNSDISSSDGSCAVYRNTMPAAPAVTTVIGNGVLLQEATSASWHHSNKVLFVAGPSLTQRVKGVWEFDAVAQPPSAQKLYSWLTAYASGSLDLRSNPDESPVWSPDGRYFVTYRQAQSVHYVPISDTVGGLRINRHIVLYERANLNAPRVLLLVDQGSLSGKATWSPDGKYVLYTVFSDFSSNADVWWLNVQTGETGKLTNDGLSLAADWLPTHQRGGVPGGPTATPNPALMRRLYLPVAVRLQDSAPPTGNYGTPVAYPANTPVPQPTPLPTPINPTAVPPRGIYGRVIYKGASVADINVNLERCVPSLPCEVVLRAKTDANGRYAFVSAPNSPLFGYSVSFYNSLAEGQNTPDAHFVAFMTGKSILSTSFGERVDAGALEIADVPLIGPADNASLATPVTFNWTVRGIAGDSYKFVMSWGGLGDCKPNDFSAATSHTIAGLDCAFPALLTGQPYLWAVAIQNIDGSFGESRAHGDVYTIEICRDL